MVQNITDRFSNNLIATAYPDFFVNAIDKYPYTGLVNDLAAGDDYAPFYSCHPKEILRALLDLYTREFMDELANNMALGNILTAFGINNPSGADTAATILQQIDRDQLLDYLILNYPTASASVVTYFDNVHDENQGNPVLLHALTECQFKECLNDNWDSIIGSDTTAIYSFVRYNDWISIATSVFASYPDSFTRAFAYTYPTTLVADLLENWHYSLYAFMDGVESFYGAGMKDKIDGDTLVLTQYVRMKEFHLYGSSRLGILNQNDTLKRADLHYKLSISDPQAEPELFVETENYNKYAPDSIYTLRVGKKLYEGNNHLGNVLVTFSDKRLGYCDDDTVYRYRADIRTANDYSAFGAQLDDRQWYSTADSGVYRFGFNGQEKDNEAKGLGNSLDFGARIYDSRLGRWLSIDPLFNDYPGYSSYLYCLNTPIQAQDPDGRIVVFVNGYRRSAYNDWNKRSAVEKVMDPQPMPGDPERLSRRDKHDYWEGQNSREGIDDMFRDEFGDYNSVYADGSNEPTSQASSRYLEGRIAGEVLYQAILNGDVQMGVGETIKIVGHSHGAAYAAGMAEYLHSKFDENTFNYKVEAVIYVAPHQPTQITSPIGVPALQYSRKSDAVSSGGTWKGPIIGTENGGSEFGEITNARLITLGNRKASDGHGGHSIYTFDEVFDPNRIAASDRPGSVVSRPATVLKEVVVKPENK